VLFHPACAKDAFEGSVQRAARGLDDGKDKLRKAKDNAKKLRDEAILKKVMALEEKINQEEQSSRGPDVMFTQS
jgi:hypothetical protein